ncbi:EXS family-domain-containing protein [Paraphysoderma sedebokerense]|nr:EXS family-domain-containing protein [Paraphysoderma sedebokerense]
MYRIITAPSTKVQFRDFFIADQLVSLSYTLSMLQIIGCYPPLTMSLASESDDDITSSFTCSISNSWLTPVLAMLPPFWRLLQCLRRYYDSKRVNPHLINGGKYLSGVINIWAAATWRVKGTTPALAFWVVFSIISTLYGYAWDILMDWGFLQPTTKHKYLRDRLFYSKRWFYYFAMISNFVFRCSWTLSMIPTTAFIRHKDLLAWSIALFEMLRRWQWNFIRMENEHATNCGMFRATLEIPIPKFEPPTDEDEDRRKRYEEGDDEIDGESHGLISLTKLKKRKQSNLQPRATNLLKESYRYRDYDRNDNHDDDQDAMEHGYGRGPDMMNNNGATEISLEEGVDLGVSQNAGTMSKLRFDTTGARDREGPIEEIDPEKNSSRASPIIAKSVLGTEQNDRRTSKDDSVQVVIDT